MSPKTHTSNEVVAIMTGAVEPGGVGYDAASDPERTDQESAAGAANANEDG